MSAEENGLSSKFLAAPRLRFLLPHVPYLTRMDLFVLGSTILVFVPLAEVVWTSALVSGSEFAKARRGRGQTDGGATLHLGGGGAARGGDRPKVS